MSTPSTEDSDSSRSEDRKSSKKDKSKKTKKSDQKPNKNDKGRFQTTPIASENTMTELEKKRKREDENLKTAETKNSKAKSKEGSSKSNQFSSEEVKAILLSLFNGLNDKDACEEFFKVFNKSTRTKAAVKAKVAKLREELTNRINGITDQDQERNGLPSFHFLLDSRLFLLISFLLSFFSPLFSHLLPHSIRIFLSQVLGSCSHPNR